MTTSQEKSIDAFLTALSEQDESLPASLQAQLKAIGQNLQSRAVELPEIAASLPALNQAYQNALQSDSPQGATPVSYSPDDSSQLMDKAQQILTADDPVQAAQRKHGNAFKQIASNPIKRLFRRG